MSQEPGILAVWNDCDRTRESEYESWYRNEHLPERVGVPGFRFGRRYEAIGGASPRFFTYYELDAPGILVSAPYLERSNNPTPWTRKIMGEQIFRNINRTACRQAWRIGALRGAYVLAIRWVDAAAVAAAAHSMREPAAVLIEKGVATRAEFWQAVAEGTGTRSVEQSLRSGDDKSIAGALLIEATRDKDLAEASQALAASGQGTEIGAYRLLCELNRADMVA